MFEKVSRSLKYDSKFSLSTNIYMYIYNIYGHQHQSVYPTRATRAGYLKLSRALDPMDLMVFELTE